MTEEAWIEERDGITKALLTEAGWFFAPDQTDPIWEYLANAVMRHQGKELDPMEIRLLDQFAADQVTSVKVDGRLAYLRTELWAGAKDGDHERACRYLVRYGMKDLVRRRFDTQALSAVVREAALLGEELNPNLLKAISVTEKVELRTKRS